MDIMEIAMSSEDEEEYKILDLGNKPSDIIANNE